MDTIHLPAPDLPSSDSPSLSLVHPTAAEKFATWQLNSQEWRGPLSVPAYCRREEFIHDQPLTRDGGVTFWALVNTLAHTSTNRKVIASCETYRKRALVTRGNGTVEEVVSHVIGNVFCDPQLRGRGYAARMMEEIGEKLYTWQQEDGRKVDYTVLYSDIGKKFYARAGWQAFSSAHITLPNVAVENPILLPYHVPASRPLLAKDLADLCQADEAQLKSKMVHASSKSSGVQVAFIPDIHTLEWHHAREEFIAAELHDRSPVVKGAIVEGQVGERVWCVWTRTFGKTKAESILHVLRLVVESKKEQSDTKAKSGNNMINSAVLCDAHVLAVASVLLAAQHEAANWDMQNVEIWNPTRISVLAAQKLEPSTVIVNRDKKSITSFRWYGDKPSCGTVEWVLNERYGWC